MKSLIKTLVETHAPSGNEGPLRNVIRREIDSLVNDLQVDNLGNLIAKKGTPETGADGMKIMLAAHMDEIGIAVTHIDRNGFARFMAVGTIRRTSLVGARVRFMNGVLGVIGNEEPLKFDRLPELAEMYIDFGVSSRSECPVKIGDMAVLEQPFCDLGNRLVGKALDDRLGVAVMIDALRRLKDEAALPNQAFFVFSVQEEVGARGAPAAAFGLDPDIGLAIDVTPTGDTPNGLKMDIHLGQGPGIKVRDQKMLADPRVVDWMVSTAEEAGLPYQLEVLEIGSTDAYGFQLSRAGVMSGCLSIPVRNVHTPSEMADFNDIENAAKLLVELLRRPAKISEYTP